MGLDMYAYVAARAGQQKEFYDDGYYDKDAREYVNPKVAKPVEIAYWRKHPNLHGWFESLWQTRGCQRDNDDDLDFNGIELELFSEDIDRLEADINNSLLPETQGFFFGDPSDQYYRESDLKFIKEARFHLFMGLRVFYNSSW